VIDESQIVRVLVIHQHGFAVGPAAELFVVVDTG
jgi:hypothetical protein